MKAWTTPDIMELDITQTAHDNFDGRYFDGGYIGDGHIGVKTHDKSKAKCPIPEGAMNRWEAAFDDIMNGIMGFDKKPEDSLS